MSVYITSRMADAGPTSGTGVLPNGKDPYSQLSTVTIHSTETITGNNLKLYEQIKYSPTRGGNNKAHETKTSRRHKAKISKQSKKRNRK